jgi:septal ring factor EnvC (AmiA/AmiB activator)
MDRYSVIVVSDETAPVRRFEVLKETVRRGLWVAGVSAALLTLCLGDYVRVRIAHSELERLRREVVEQRERISAFDSTLEQVTSRLERISDFERKVRIIANLPGSAATGGEEVAELGRDAAEADARLDSGEVTSPDGPLAAPGAAKGETKADSEEVREEPREEPRLEALQRDAQKLGQVADLQELSLARLADELESKRDHLASTPAIWPAKGWMTSRFGSRTSPFTNRKQFHAGIDIAGERGTDVVSPARGRVEFAGKRGPLGNSLIIDHGFGVRTVYGHTDDFYVNRGDSVERGQRIASLGNSGRSTGPHLHYVVEVEGKAVNPLDYIFD